MWIIRVLCLTVIAVVVVTRIFDICEDYYMSKKQVIATDLKIKIDKDTAFKAPNNKWYSSEAAYNEIRENNEYKNKTTELAFQLLGYDSNQKMCTYWFKRIKEFNGYPAKVVYGALLCCADSIQQAFAVKTFEKDVFKISYIISCISNNINDVYRKISLKEKAEKLAENNKEIVDIEVATPNTNRKHDISNFL